jgi:hypothetical protein
MAVDIETVKLKVSEGNKRLLEIGGIAIAITGIAGIWSWYLNHFWKPVVVVQKVDFKNGNAKIKVGTKDYEIYGNANFSISNFGDWGVRFGTSEIDGNILYDRIELTKNNLVVEYLQSQGSAIV